MGSIEKDPLTPGMRVGKLTVIERLNNPRSIYRCKCDCGREKNIYKNNLTSGRTTSCGCRQKEIVSNMFSKQNKFVFADDYVIGKASNTGKEFLIDRADYEKVKDYCWHETKKGYIATKGKIKITLHRFLMNPPDDLVVDHKNHNKADNRRSNLRVCTTQQNCMNRTIPPKGIQEKKSGNKTYYTVFLNGKYRGTFKDYESAKTVRDQVYEQEYSFE